MKKKHRAARSAKASAKLQADRSTEAVIAPSPPADSRPEQRVREPIEPINLGALVPYDENLLERSRTQWQFGDWASLAQLDRETLQHHPERAKLALLAAAGHLQSGDSQAARQFTRLAHDWGCNQRLISQILIASVHNTLGRAAALAGQEGRALRHFESSIAVGAPASELRLLTRARAQEQLTQLALLPTGGSLIEGHRAPPAGVRSESPRPTSEMPEAIVRLVDDCLAADDALEAIDRLLASQALGADDTFLFFLLLSDRFREEKDTLTALHFLNCARESTSVANSERYPLLAKRFIRLGRASEAADLFVQHSLTQATESDFSDEDRKALSRSYESARAAQMEKAEHGHELLLAHLRSNLSALLAEAKDRELILIEIGTTRENVPGQGSTRKIADFCKEHAIHFITVDMDPHNTRVAGSMFDEICPSFEAITGKGEDYLRDYVGYFDIIFLDAYDFDHGRHSRLRQSRYEKFLGAPVDDGECHRMHLDCARSVASKLSPNGLVCIDDTWLEDGQWTAKGTLAMPYLLEHGFRLLDARNRAALLCRQQEAPLDG